MDDYAHQASAASDAARTACSRQFRHASLTPLAKARKGKEPFPAGSRLVGPAHNDPGIRQFDSQKRFPRDYDHDNRSRNSGGCQQPGVKAVPCLPLIPASSWVQTVVRNLGFPEQCTGHQSACGTPATKGQQSFLSDDLRPVKLKTRVKGQKVADRHK